MELKIIHDQGGNKSHSSNLRIHAASGEIVAFLDSDCVANAHWITTIELNSYWKAIGGPYIPAQETPFAYTTYNVLGEVFGKFTAQFARLSDKGGRVKAVPRGNSAFQKSVLDLVAGLTSVSMV